MFFAASSNPKFRSLAAILTLLLAAEAAFAETGTAHGWIPTGDQIVGMPVLVQIALIIAGTLVSEDLTCIAIGVLIGKGQIDWWVGGIACFLGIYIGDLTFFYLGRIGGKGLTRLKFFTRGFGPEKLASFGDWFDRKPWAAIAMCRVLPGLRVPLYLAVGGLTKRTAAFFWWTAFFAFIWTPALIALVAMMGDAFTRPFEAATGSVAWSIALAIAAIYLLVRFVMLMSSASGRETLANRFGFLWGRRKVHLSSEESSQPGSIANDTAT